MKPETPSDQVVQLDSSTMKSLSLAALLVSLIAAFDDLKSCEANRQFSYRVEGAPHFGDQGGLAGVPVRVFFRRANSLGTDSGDSAPYGGRGYGAASDGLQIENTGRLDGGDSYGRSDADQYGGIKRITRRRVIFILVRRRRPRSQDDSGSREDGERWGGQGRDYSSDDQSLSLGRRARHALLRALLKKILFAAARQSSVSEGAEEGQGGDFGADQQWGRSEPGGRSGRRFGESSDSMDAFTGRGGRLGQGGLGLGGVRFVVRLRRPNAVDNSDLYGSGIDQGTENGPQWISGESLSGSPGAIWTRGGERGDVPFSDAANGGNGYGTFSIVRNDGAGRQGNPFNEMSASGSGPLTDSTGFRGPGESFPIQPSTWQGSESRFPQYANQFVRGNEGTPYGGISRGLQPQNQGSNDYPSVTSNLGFTRGPGSNFEGGQAGSPAGSYYSTFGGAPVNPLTAGSSTGYPAALGGLPGQNPTGTSGFNGAYGVNNPADFNTANVKA